MAWHSAWIPVVGDRVEVRSELAVCGGTVIEVGQGEHSGMYKVRYDQPVSSSAPFALAGESETGWHRRDELEPSGPTLHQFRQEQQGR
jgi:hypothetical protein